MHLKHYLPELRPSRNQKNFDDTFITQKTKAKSFREGNFFLVFVSFLFLRHGEKLNKIVL